MRFPLFLIPKFPFDLPAHRPSFRFIFVSFLCIPCSARTAIGIPPTEWIATRDSLKDDARHVPWMCGGASLYTCSLRLLQLINSEPPYTVYTTHILQSISSHPLSPYLQTSCYTYAKIKLSLSGRLLRLFWRGSDNIISNIPTELIPNFKQHRTAHSTISSTAIQFFF